MSKYILQYTLVPRDTKIPERSVHECRSQRQVKRIVINLMASISEDPRWWEIEEYPVVYQKVHSYEKAVKSKVIRARKLCKIKK